MIWIDFREQEFYGLTVQFEDNCKKRFDPTNSDCNYKDIEEFYQSRLHKGKLTQVKVQWSRNCISTNINLD